MLPAMSTNEEPAERLRKIGETGEEPLDIADAALMLSALDHEQQTSCAV